MILYSYAHMDKIKFVCMVPKQSKEYTCAILVIFFSVLLIITIIRFFRFKRCNVNHTTNTSSVSATPNCSLSQKDKNIRFLEE